MCTKKFEKSVGKPAHGRERVNEKVYGEHCCTGTTKIILLKVGIFDFPVSMTPRIRGIHITFEL